MTGERPQTTDVLVVGSGIAGLTAALAAVRNETEVTIITKATRPADTSSWHAQGGIAVSRDDPPQFKQDIIEASDGTADPEAVDVLVQHANDAVHDVLLDTLDVEFDRPTAPDGDAENLSNDFAYCREAAHSTDRILHVDASTGKHVHVPLLNHLDDHPNVEILTDTAALDLVTHEGRVHGAVVESPDSDSLTDPVFAGATILATGGIGDCFPTSTNPAGSTGDGLAMAALAGADVADMAYVQFHPTVCLTDPEDAFLVSEAVRGAGALLRNAVGERFMPDVHPDAELAPRDVVARAVDREVDRTGGVELDVSPLDFPAAFPDLAQMCETRGVDWTAGIPVEPAEHFLCGGIAVDDRGRTTLDGLYAVGECARTGVHGANRLASTSLLEGIVWGRRAGEASATAGREPEPIETPQPDSGDPALPDAFALAKFGRLQQTMGECLGVQRDADGIQRALGAIRRLKGEVDAYTRTRTSRSLYELRNATIVALLVTRAAADTTESRGCHSLTSDAPSLQTDGGRAASEHGHGGR